MEQSAQTTASSDSKSKFDLEDIIFIAKRKIQAYTDRVSPYLKERWIAFTIVLSFFLLRMYLKQGYAVIAYLLGLFYLNSLMLYLAPVEDLENENVPGDFTLPVRENDEYKGF